MNTKKEYVIGTVYAGGCEFYALGITGLCDNDGNELPGFAWRVVHTESPKGDYIYQTPFTVIGGAFISRGAMGSIPYYVEIEVPDEEEELELPNDADIDEEQILRDAMYADMQSMIETFKNSEYTDEEEI